MPFYVCASGSASHVVLEQPASFTLTDDSGHVWHCCDAGLSEAGGEANAQRIVEQYIAANMAGPRAVSSRMRSLEAARPGELPALLAAKLAS